MRMPRSFFLVAFAIFTLSLGIQRALAQVTLLIPAKPEILAPQAKAEPPKGKKAAQGKTRFDGKNESIRTNSTREGSQDSSLLENATIHDEIDVLITLMEPFRHKSYAMDMPQAFAVLRYDADSPVRDGHIVPERRDLLGDVEEILYMGQKAWGANVGLLKPGLFQFIMETRPWWDQEKKSFIQHYVKAFVPVYNEGTGYHEAAGQYFEIVPLTRPFGLIAPAFFSAQVLLAGRPLPNVEVSLERVNTDSQKVLTPWHEKSVMRTDHNGQFAFVPNRSGWWSCHAKIQGAPLKGADGQPKDLELGAILWFYADIITDSRRP